MPADQFTLAIFLASILAGLVGALTGLGGGIIVTPTLTLFLGVDMRYAIGASLVSLIASSSGAASGYVRDGLSNIRIGMFLEIATTIGAICGALLAAKTPTSALSLLFGVLLLQSAWQAVRARAVAAPAEIPADSLGKRLRLGGVYHAAEGAIPYEVVRVQLGFAIMYGAGVLSGLLGIGSGAFKVLAMDRVMRAPFKVSTATSSFMIGVTGLASAAIYFKRGYIHPIIALPVMLGVLAGAAIGARLLPRMPVKTLRRIFAVAVAVVAIQMIRRGLLEWIR